MSKQVLIEELKKLGYKGTQEAFEAIITAKRIGDTRLEIKDGYVKFENHIIVKSI